MVALMAVRLYAPSWNVLISCFLAGGYRHRLRHIIDRAGVVP
jgi:hypothetical protein